MNEIVYAPSRFTEPRSTAPPVVNNYYLVVQHYEPPVYDYPRELEAPKPTLSPLAALGIGLSLSLFFLVLYVVMVVSFAAGPS